jgi:hypothetical protein
MSRYTEEQKAEAVRLQMQYRGEVKTAHAKLDEAGRTMTREVNEAEARRNEALRDVGVDVNDMRDLATK